MASGFLIRLWPAGPWRIGPDSGDRDRVDRIYHSDSLFSAVSGAMAQLGRLEEWLDATARAERSAVRLSSLFPFQGDALLAPPPRSLWPPPASTKVRWKAARFVPLSLVQSMIAGRATSEDAWTVDPVSECLIPSSNAPQTGPFRTSVRSGAGIDRAGVSAVPHSTACLEFAPGAGLWMAAAFSSDQAAAEWREPLTAAMRLLSDSGFGGERSRGWGRVQKMEVEPAPALLSANGPEAGATAWWLLSLYHPAAGDAIVWQSGNYSLSTRGGRVESPERWGELKKPTRMVMEGSVLIAAEEPRGTATDVAPDNFPHPVYRAGFALAVAIPAKPRRAETPKEIPKEAPPAVSPEAPNETEAETA